MITYKPDAAITRGEAIARATLMAHVAMEQVVLTWNGRIVVIEESHESQIEHNWHAISVNDAPPDPDTEF